MLFTRCPECDTTFRVTDETLKKANGQVRCGRCASVFNAYAELHDPTAKTFEPEAVKARSAAEGPPPPMATPVTPLPAPPPAGTAAEHGRHRTEHRRRVGRRRRRRGEARSG